MSFFSFASFKESFELGGIYLKAKATDCIEFVKVVFNYYSNPGFFKIDSYLLLSYVFDNPFKISKRFLKSKGASNIYTYGETPLATLEFISEECRLTSADRVFELGCGRGRTCFWLNHFIGCSVVGVEYVPEFVKRANQVKNKFALSAVEFRQEDLLVTSLRGATVIYLYGTCFPRAFIEILASRFEALPSGTKIITVSYPLSDYTSTSSFETMKRFTARFTWGITDVYLQIRK